MPLSLSNLIDHVGLSHITVQTIDGSVTAAKKMVKTGRVRLTLETDHYRVKDVIYPDDAKMFGLVVWMPRERLPKYPEKL